MAGKPAQEVREVPAFPIHVDVRAVPLQIKEIRLALADDLVRERNFAVPCVTRLRTLHVAIVSWRGGLDVFARPF